MVDPSIMIIGYSALILLVVNAFYKFMINQEEAGRIKDRVKALGDEAKSYRGDKEHTKKIYDEMMGEQRKIMKMTLKPMILSLVVVAIILPLLALSYNDQIIELKDGKGSMAIDGRQLEVTLNGNQVSATGLSSFSCDLPCRHQKIGESFWNADLDGQKVKFSMIAVTMPVSLPILGADLGWIFWYLIVSIPLMILIRKFYGIKV